VRPIRAAGSRRGCQIIAAHIERASAGRHQNSFTSASTLPCARCAMSRQAPGGSSRVQPRRGCRSSEMAEIYGEITRAGPPGWCCASSAEKKKEKKATLETKPTVAAGIGGVGVAEIGAVDQPVDHAAPAPDQRVPLASAFKKSGSGPAMRLLPGQSVNLVTQLWGPICAPLDDLGPTACPSRPSRIGPLPRYGLEIGPRRGPGLCLSSPFGTRQSRCARARRTW